MGLPVGTGATQAASQSRAGAGPAALCSTDQMRHSAAKVKIRPPTGLTLKSAGLKSLIYSLFLQGIILILLLQDIPNNNPLLPKKRVLSTTGFTLL